MEASFLAHVFGHCLSNQWLTYTCSVNVSGDNLILGLLETLHTLKCIILPGIVLWQGWCPWIWKLLNRKMWNAFHFSVAYIYAFYECIKMTITKVSGVNHDNIPVVNLKACSLGDIWHCWPSIEAHSSIRI